jgi:predicted DsbA family dithiol-disulfide isomerase
MSCSECDALRAEVKRLRGELVSSTHLNGKWMDESTDAKCRAEKAESDLDTLAAFKAAVVGSLNPLRPGDDATFWGKDLGDPSTVRNAVESLRSQRDAAREAARVMADAIFHVRLMSWPARVAAAVEEYRSK